MATEEERALLWRQQQLEIQARRAELAAKLAGSPAARLDLEEKWAALRDAIRENRR